MSFEMEMPDSFDNQANFLRTPGTFHLAVLDVDENPKSKKEELLDGFKVSLEVMAGPCKGQQTSITLFAPDLQGSDKAQRMAIRKRGFFVKAVQAVPDTVKPGEKVNVDLQLAVGRQFIATLAFSEKDGKPTTFLDFHYADIWHIDDPSAPPCERNQDAIKLLPKELRRDAATFAKADSKPAGGKPSGNGNGSGSAAPTAAAPPVTAGAAMSADELLS